MSTNNIKNDLEKAFHWYQKAVEGGDVRAIYGLAFCYKYGEGTEKDLEKAFHWCQKAAEGGDVEAMRGLAIRYRNGEGTEKDLEKAFHWCQKAAEGGDVEAMRCLAIYYKNGEGIEKDLEKAFNWYQKAAEGGNYQKVAESGDVRVMRSLANRYYNGDGTEKNLEKAFHWYQKAAEGGDVGAMNSLANYYYNGERMEKDLEKAFHWYQKAAEGGDVEAMHSLAICYKNGEGTVKNLEKVFYCHQKTVEINKISFKNEFCNKCKQPYTEYQWCQQCNSKQFRQEFSKWTSKNKYIDKFIQEAQLNAKNNYEVLEWIPYDKLLNINYYDKGGFSKIHKANWLDGPIDSWNFDKQQWNRWIFQAGYNVILKTLNNSLSIDDKFLDEWKYHYNCQKNSFSKFIQIFGITQDPYNLNYMIVMSYAKKGNLRKCLSDIIKLKCQAKLQLLKKIILGLKVIHESDLIHSDLHDDNILMSDNHNELFIIDLGLCKPISNLQTSGKKDNEIYGVVPYMAPEVLRKKPYTPASDIYSFSIIMWEFTSGIPPFNDKAHDHQLIYDICKGERPEIKKNTPKCYVDLMKRCWDSNPSNRPTITELEYEISEWIRCISKFYEINRDGNDMYLVPDVNNKLYDDMLEFVKANNTLAQEQTDISTIVQLHSQAYYTSRNITEILVKENSECLEYIIEV
ncbi:hypothetical protein RclHR1_06730006 [Rhizophagus clarus]|uniref:Protein kinase domain-containing protein n=1 Tax=Rhizophagus clarus TaxID=94130 RepID=A0A2Z6S9S7_9GLOM|nr:hypothetical protein RclHR1_06730006 [Rhizophagus clarus]